MREHGGLFTSDLSVAEFVLADQAGVKPISQVMGSSVYHVGWQNMPRGSFGGFGRSTELQAMTQALNESRQIALKRMEEEADRVGANAVVGVRIDRGGYDFAPGLVEFSALGTAVRVPGLSEGRPAVTNLSGQDFWKLHQAGYWPLGVAAGSTVYYVMGGWQTQMANSFYGSYANMELQDFTAGLYQARNAAMHRLQAQARHLGATGVVGVEIEQTHVEQEAGSGGGSRTDMIFTFHALGTAIIESDAEQQIPAVSTVLTL
ncbi:MAG: heavy metal-binding domain-containing protein [Chloroflexota bacterium]